MNPQFPIYIPSKGRFKEPLRLTARALTKMGVPYMVVVEEQEYADYAKVEDKRRLIVLDEAYKRDFETLDEFGDTKPKGTGPVRNFIWDHAVASGAAWHWQMDDNIRSFQRMHNHKRIRVADGTVLKAMEDFCLRYRNVAMAGPSYAMFAVPKHNYPPFAKNTRIYSCALIRNDTPFRFRGRGNVDTILSLDMMKAGWCTIQFYTFLQEKMATQTMDGGMNDDVYKHEGRLPKTELLRRAHPDVVSVVWKWNRPHHQINYLPFKSTPLVYRDGYTPPTGIDNYGMELRRVNRGEE